MSIKKDFFAPSTTGRGATRRAAMLLVMMLTTVTAWAQTTITPTTPSQDGDGNYLIGNAAELYGFAELVNDGNKTANAKLTADIVVNENVLDANGEAKTGDFVQWTPIGNDFEGKVYSGTFDGQGHTISGLYVSGNGWNVGFVGRVSGIAVVKNLGIVDSYFSSSNNLLGSIVGGVANNSSVTLANVYSTSTVNGDNWIGGLVGGDENGSVTIINSYFAGKTSANFQSGQYGTHHDDLVAGDFNRSTLTVCNAFVLGTSQYGTSVTAGQLSDGTVAAALHYYQDALADGSMFGLSGGKTNFSGTIDGVSVTTANITLHTFDGNATAYSSKYVVGNTTPLPVNVEREGYTFFGWYDNADLEGDAVTSISSSETDDKEYWAKFERSHAVSFVLGGGTIRSGEIDHYIEGETTALPTMVFKNGASFEGWYTTEDFTGSRYYSIPSTATEDMTFYAKWGAEKTTFYLMQGGSPEPVSILYEGESIVWLDETTVQRYVIYHNEYGYWGSGGYIPVPYDGGEYAFSNSGNKFSVAQSGFYVFTLTDKGEGNWFVSVLKSMLNCDVASIPTQVYTGSAIEPDVTVKDGETTLTLGTDYDVAYSNNVNAGTATVTITGKGNYSGETAATFTIVYPTVTTSYVDATGTLHDGVEAVPLDNTMTTLPAGTYVVNSDVAYTGTVTLSGDVTLILGDGKTMTVTNTGTGNEDFAIYGESGSLHIYGQSQGTGALTATANSSVAIKVDDNITIDGGIVNATSTGDVGIYGIDGVTINGGTVNAKGIYSDGDITINGGKVTATATGNSGICSNNGTIILGLSNATDYITAESYSGAVKVADGQTLTDGTEASNGMNGYSGTLTDEQITAIGGKTLRRAVITSYVDATGTLHENVIAIPLDNTMTTLAAGWYVVNSDVAYTGTVTLSGDVKLTLSGDVKLILSDDCTMSFGKEGELLNATIMECNNHNLTIYGQSGGTGWLKAYSAQYDGIKNVNYYTQYSGNVVISDGNGACIYAREFTILGGTLDLKDVGGANGEIVTTENINIRGGKLWAWYTGLKTNGKIILDYTNATDQIRAYSYQFQNGLEIADGKTLVDENGTIWSGTLEVVHQIGFNNSTLKPVMGVTLTKEGNNVSATFSGSSETTLSIPVDVNVTSVTYNRAFTMDKPSTVMLPFNKAVSEIGGGTFYTFGGVEKKNNKWEATMNEVTGSLTKNTPYLFVPAGTSLTFTGGATLNTTGGGNCLASDAEGWEFHGTYSKKLWNEVETHDYGFAATSGTSADDKSVEAGQFVRLTTGASAKPMRCYLSYVGVPNQARAKTRGAAATDEELPSSIIVRLVGANGQTTGIGTIDTKTGEMTFDSEAWYTLDGVRLSGKPTKKGLYINNGKKVVIK